MPVLDFPGGPPPHPRCWVRVTREREDGFVEFDFALGDPDLCVDLILSRAAFDEFCARQGARRLDDQQAQAVHDERQRWRHARD